MIDPVTQDTPVSLDTVNPVTTPVSVDTQAEGSPTPAAPIAENRSKKASYGVGELLGKSQPEIYTLMMQGRENDLRNEASAKIDAKNDQARVQNVIDLVNKQGKTLTMDQMDALRRPPSDPNAVFEDGYAEKYVQNLFKADANMNGTDLSDAMSIAPDAVMRDVDKGKDQLSNYEYARRRQEDMSQQYQNEGTIPWLYDQARNAIPFYSAIKMNQQSNLPGWLPGSNLDEQTRALLRLPGPEFRKQLDTVLDHLSNDKGWIDNANPSLALQYVNAVMGMSTAEVGLGNVMNIVDASTLPIGSALKSGLKSVMAVRKGIADGVAAANVAHATPATIAEGFGDTGTAATLRASDEVLSDIKGTTPPVSTASNLVTPNDPIARAKAAIPSGLNVDKASIAANGGPLSRELHTRIMQDQDVASKAIVDVIEKTAKVQQIPLEEAGPIVMNRIKDEVRNQNPGIKNAIADIGDPVFNPFSNTYNFPVKLFNPTGEQFATEQGMRRFLNEYGIAEADIVGKPKEKVYAPASVFTKLDPETGKVIPARFTIKNTEEGVQVISHQPEVKLNNAGKPIGYSDKKFVDSEVQTTTVPQPGHVGINIKTGEIDKVPLTADTAPTARIQQQGLGYHAVVWKPLDQSQSIIKDLTIALDSTKSVASRGGVEAWFNSIFPVGYVRTADSTLSPFEMLQRKTATYSISNYQALLQNEVKYIEDIARGRIRVDPVTGEDHNAIASYVRSLSPVNYYKDAKGKWNDFKRALAAAPGIKDPGTGVNGYLHSNPYEINQFWQENFGRPASFEEIRGWLAFKRNYENDRVFRSVREYTNKARLGAEQHQFSYIDNQGNKIQSGFFDGVQHKSMPGGEYPILIMDGPNPRIRMTNQMGSDWKPLDKAVGNGEMVVTEIYAPELRPLKSLPGVGRNYVRYVVAPAANRETKGLGWDQVNRLSGGHFQYDYENAVKEANIQETRAGNKTYHSYEGDTTFMFVNGRAQGKQVINVLNAVKQALREGDEVGARSIFENGLKGDKGPAMEWKDFISKTKSTKDEFGNTVPPSININEPFHVVPKGKSIIDMDNSIEKRYGSYDERGEFQSTFQDRTRGGSLSRQYQVGYTQERDAENVMALSNVGSKNNPIYKYEPAKMVDPIVTMNRALNEITRSTVMDDMKVSGIETWLREAESYLKAPNLDDIRSRPFWYFKNADSKDAFKPGADPTTVANLLSNRFKTQQFLGMPSKYDVFMHDTAQKIADWSYDTMGPKGELVPTWAFTKLTSPVQMLRTFAYHAKLGLFAVSQLITQSQTYLTIGAMAPRSAPAGTYAAMLSQWAKLSVNPAFIDTLDHWATKLSMPVEKGTGTVFHGWKPGEFKEAYQEMNNRGFANVGSEYTTLDTQMNSKFTRGVAGDVLDAGQMFFKMAEQNVRYGAWFTAYKEYRAANPGIRTMSRTDFDIVLNRADDMSGNMTRASASIMQSGPLSLTGQFMTYQMHAAELYWGKRLGETTTERALARFRMNAMYGAAFGVGGTLGIAGLPLTQLVRKAALDNGYVVGDDWLQSIVMEGPTAAALAWATSTDGSPQKGNWYNISDKFGVGGLTFLTDALKSDAKWYTFLGGAATSIAGNTWKNSEGLRRSSWDLLNASMMTGKEEDKAFPMKLDDWMAALSEVSSVDAVRKASDVVQFGKWISKNGAYQADVSKANGIFMALTGLNLQNAADNYVIGQDIKERQDKMKEARNNFSTEIHRAIQAAQNNDWPSYKEYMTRGYGYLEKADYPIEDYPKALAIASKGWETRINSIREEFYTKSVPAGKEDTSQDAYTRFLQTQGQ